MRATVSTTCQIAAIHALADYVAVQQVAAHSSNPAGYERRQVQSRIDFLVLVLAGCTDTAASQANNQLICKTLHDQGAAAFSLIDTILDDIRPLAPHDQTVLRVLSEHLIVGTVALRNSVQWLLKAPQGLRRESHHGAHCYLELWRLVCSGWMHLLRLQAAQLGTTSPGGVAATPRSIEVFAQYVGDRSRVLAATMLSAGDGPLALAGAGRKTVPRLY